MRVGIEGAGLCWSNSSTLLIRQPMFGFGALKCIPEMVPNSLCRKSSIHVNTYVHIDEPQKSPGQIVPGISGRLNNVKEFLTLVGDWEQ
ncbi:hypothetical protein EMCRGX_G020465 [Ephydatia muelleri]